MIMRLALAAVFLSTLAPCQSTFLVNSSGGGDFTTIGAAIAAAVPGDTVLVSSGTYPGVRLEKGIRLIALGPASLLTLRVAFLPADQTATIVGFDLGESFGPNTTVLSITGCQGPVFCEDLNASGISPVAGFVRPTVSVSVCALVTFKDCEFIGRAGMQVENSTVILAGCDLVGGDAIRFLSDFVTSSPGLNAIDSEIIVSETSFEGGDGVLDPAGMPVFPPRSAIELTGGSLRLCGGSLRAGDMNTPLIGGDGALVLPLGSDLCALLPGVMDCKEVILPCVMVGRATRGSPLPITMSAPEGSFTCIFAGLSSPRQPTPWGDLWIDQGTIRGLFLGLVPSGGIVSMQVPNVPMDLPIGEEWTIQAAVITVAGEVGVSPPVDLVVR